MNASFTLTIEGAPELVVVSFEAHERSHVEAFARVKCRSRAGEADSLRAADLVGNKATLETAQAGGDRSEARRFHGIVDAEVTSADGVLFTLIPRLMPLADNCDHRVFLEKDSVTIAETLLNEAGLTLDVRVAERPKARLQRVQAFESTLAFVRRILAEDGVSLWVEHGPSEDVVVISDSSSSCLDLPGGAALPFRPGEGLSGEEAIFDLTTEEAITHDGAAVTDFDPDKPAVVQDASVGGDRMPLFVFPGKHKTPDEGRERARLLLEEAQSEKLVIRGRTNCRHVAVGLVMEITDSPRREQNGRFRILEVHHRGQDFSAGDDGGTRYEASVRAVPVDTPVRPRREAPRGFGGLQTMTVTGPSGGEIHTDARGSVKMRFRWDRLSGNDDTSSAWVRPVQPPLSGGFFLPRVGWEVLTGFLADPIPTGDTPIELGRLVHGAAPPAESLPAQKVRSNWGTATTPGGGKKNQLRFDDAAGNEGMLVAASADFNERTENDKVTSVTANETNIVGGDHTNTVTIQQNIAVKGVQTYSVGGNRDLTTVGTLGISAASESVSIGGIRKLTIGGDYESKAASLSRVVGAAENVLAIQEANRHVTGASTIAVGGTWTEIGGVSASTGVLGASTLTVAGPLSIRASKGSVNASVLTEKYAGVFKGHAGSNLTVKSAVVKVKAGGALKAKGADVFFKAKTKITVKAGGVTITITPGSIKVKGNLKGDSTSVVTTKEEIG